MPLTFTKHCQLLSRKAALLCTSPRLYAVYCFSLSLPALLIFWLSNFCQSLCIKWYITFVLIYINWITVEVVHSSYNF